MYCIGTHVIKLIESNVLYIIRSFIYYVYCVVRGINIIAFRNDFASTRTKMYGHTERVTLVGLGLTCCFIIVCHKNGSTRLTRLRS